MSKGMNTSFIKVGTFIFFLCVAVSTAANSPLPPPEPLQAYALEDLQYVGYASTASKVYAVITDPAGHQHRVKVGNHLGKNYGEIMAIVENKITIHEFISDGQGGWDERENHLYRVTSDK
jgi:Tfp pilus assembly protein PilP